MSVESLLRGLVVLVGIVVVGGVALWYVNYRALADSRALVAHARAVQAELGAIEEEVLEIEVVARGYSLDGDPGAAARVAEHGAQLRAGLARLGQLTRDNFAQREPIAALDGLAATELADVGRELAAARPAAPAPGLVGRDGTLQAIRTALAAMTAEEGRLVAARAGTTQRQIDRMSALGGIALIALVAFVIGMYVLIRRQLDREHTARTAVARSERFLEAVVENLPSMVFVKDATELRFQRFNRAGEELLGQRREELLGKNDHDFFPPEQAAFFVAKDRQTLAGRAVVDIPEEPIDTAAGRRWLHTRKVPILDERGEPRYLLGISQDITDQKEAVETIRTARDQAEAANRELETFAYSVAHDLRAPLRAIDGFAHAVIDDYRAALPEEAIALLGRVRAASRRMGEVIDALLELSRLTRAELSRDRVDLSARARAIADDLGKAHPDRTVAVVVAPDLVAIGDPRLLHQVLQNLIGNAWKYTAKRPDARIEVGRQADGRRAFFVRDNGVGFDMAHKAKLFLPFQRLHAAREFEGHGIGLVTAARVVARHGGAIWADSAVGDGATFYFVLPTGEGA